MIEFDWKEEGEPSAAIEPVLRRYWQRGSILHSVGLTCCFKACRLDAQNRKEEADRWWKIVIATWGLVLHNDSFWEEWRKDAERRYQSEAPVEEIQALRKRLEGHLSKLLLECIKEKPTDHVEADALRRRRRVQTLQRELKGAALLKEFGGLCLSPSDEGRLVCGPWMIGLLGKEREFGKFAAELVERSAPAGDEEVIVIRLSDDDHPPPDYGQVKRLMRYFSLLGAAQAQLDLGYPEEALRALREAACSRCLAAAGGKGPEPPMEVHICTETCDEFASSNPAYSGLPERGRYLKEDAIDLAKHAHLALARACVTASEPDIEKAVSHWRAAARLSVGAGSGEQLKAFVRETALGRVRSLLRRGRLDDAVTLLDEAAKIFNDGELVGQLAKVLTDRGITAGNARPPRWKQAVEDLNNAVLYNPYVLRPRLNYCIALRALAGEQARQGDIAEAMILLKRCVEEAETGLTHHSNHPVLQKQRDDARRELTQM